MLKWDRSTSIKQTNRRTYKDVKLATESRGNFFKELLSLGSRRGIADRTGDIKSLAGPFFQPLVQLFFIAGAGVHRRP